MDIKDLLTKHYFKVLSLIILPVVIYSYLRVVVNDNIHIHYGVARLADFMGTFPSNVDMAWSTHPIGMRMVYYILYKLTSWAYGNELLLQVMIKGIAGIFILLTAYYFATQVNRIMPQVNKYAIFLITSLAFFTLHIMFLMEAEFFAAILSILAIALLLSPDKKANVAAGIVIVAVILMKLVTIAFVPAIIAGWILINGCYRSETLFNCLFGFEVAAGLFIAACVLWFKNIVSDIMLLYYLHDPSTLHTLSTRAYMMVVQTLSINWFMPILFVGAVTGVIIFYQLIKFSTRNYTAWFVVMWLSPLALVFIQSEFFMYQYMGLVIPCIISIIMFASVNYETQHELVLTIMVVFTLIIFGVTCSVFTDTHEHIWDNATATHKQANTQFGLTNQPEILYLDTGTTAYFTGAPSACRYTYPLVITRGYKLNQSNTQTYLSAKNCIMAYDGDYLISNGGQVIDPQINEKIESEYTKVYSGVRWGSTDSTGDIYKRNKVVSAPY